MLYFKIKPDPVFGAVLSEAFRTQIAQIQHMLERHDHETWEISYPLTGQFFSAEAALTTLTSLENASRNEQVIYRIWDEDWVLVYESLRHYCADHNERIMAQPGRLPIVGGYVLPEIEFDEMIDCYFWDTDFVVPSNCEGDAGEEGFHTLGLPLELFNRDSRHQQRSGCSLQEVGESVWQETDDPPLYRYGCHRYPDDGLAREDSDRDFTG